MQHDGSGFEEHQAVFLKDRDLPEGLQRPIVRFVLIARFKEAGLVRQTRFLQRPARAQIAHLPLRKLWNPFESRDRDHAICSLAFAWRRLKLVKGFGPADQLAFVTADAWSESSVRLQENGVPACRAPRSSLPRGCGESPRRAGANV